VSQSREDRILSDAREWLRGHLSGYIRFDGERTPVRIVVAPDGSIVMPAMVAMLISTDVVLELPNDDDESMHLMVTLEKFAEQGPHGALADRWRIYHGDPPDVNWARCTVDAVRFAGYFVDGDALMVPNPLAAGEAAACSAINRGDRSVAAAAARACGGHELADPRVVGIDPGGCDIRSDFGVVRVTWPEPVSDAAHAIAALARVAGQQA
jgi:hypothetical protein